MEADLLDNVETITTLLTTLGYPILEAIKKNSIKSKNYYIQKKNINATGTYTEEGFIVFKDSQVLLAKSQSADNHITTQRETS